MDVNGKEGGPSRSESGSGEVGGTMKEEGKKEVQRQLVVWTEENLKMADLHGQVKMWSKELWSGRL